MARFEPTLESLRTHELPAWYDAAKLGIFIHWTLASVPAYAQREADINELIRERFDDFLPFSPYTEWYENALKFPDSPAAVHHRERYGERPYAAFEGDWEAALERWDPKAWAERFAATGAGYVVLVTKHHDGYCLWPSRVPNPHHKDWCCPRDVVGELADAVRGAGMRFGVYYSGGIDWSFEPRPVRNMVEFVASMPRGDYPAYADAQVRELIERVSPEVLWNDISWPTRQPEMLRLFADYYEAVPEGLVNDRWMCDGPLFQALRVPPLRWLAARLLKRAVRRGDGSTTPPPPVHYDVRTPEYTVMPDISERKWECVRGIDKSFGYNRLSRDEDHLAHEELIHSFVDIVSKNGNLLLNVGPRGEDAAIPEAQLRRLDWLGAWLARNGEAIRGTRPWQRAEGSTSDGDALRFTRRGDELFAVVLARPRAGELRLRDVPLRDGAEVTLLGTGAVLPTRRESGDLRVELPAPPEGDDAPAFALRIPGAGDPAA